MAGHGEHMHHDQQETRTSATQAVGDHAQHSVEHDMTAQDVSVHDMSSHNMNMDHGIHQMDHDKLAEPETNPEHTMPPHKNRTPFSISVALSVCHCGAGCVLGDIIGEWIVYATNVQIKGRSLWPEMLLGSKTLLPEKSALDA